MPAAPAVALGLVGVEVVEDDVDRALGVGGDHLVHEVEELDPPAALGAPGPDQAGGDLEGREQGRGAVALVAMAEAGERLAIRQPQPALGPLERLDLRLLVDAQHHRVLRWVQVCRPCRRPWRKTRNPALTHQLRRRARLMRCALSTRHTWWRETSPSAAASSRPLERAKPAGGGARRAGRGDAPRCPRRRPAACPAAARPRARPAPGGRSGHATLKHPWCSAARPSRPAIAPVPRPAAATSTIRARAPAAARSAAPAPSPP